YGLNRIGAIASVVHPLSSQKNITYYLDYTDSKMILTLDNFYEKVRDAVAEAKRDTRILVARIQDELSPVLAAGYIIKAGKKYLKYPDKGHGMEWTNFVKYARRVTLPPVAYDKEKTAIILYSGGTSGTPKGIRLSDFGFNALGMQLVEASGMNITYGCKFLSVMPIFHGFGLGIGIHTMLENGAMCILIPQFTKDTYAQTVLKKKPHFIAGVPTLYEALLGVDALKNADLSFLKGVFSGGDSMSVELKKRCDDFFRAHNADVQIREGYGLTESVNATCLTPMNRYKEGSIGLPLRDMIFKIVEPGTFNEVPTGELGEIIISGPTIMLGYLKNEEENEKTLRHDEDGTKWLFTGDLGCVDEEGFVYFKQRIKRMIISSGYNVYPAQIEKVLNKHPDIDYCCAIGVKDAYKIHKVRAYIVLKDGIEESEEEKAKIIEYCKKYLDVIERPREIVFRKELPRTLVGKVAYRVLEEEAAEEEKNK
ncbi:MAG: AMP-binding protein, partial [Clostridia bacterium]|nr:AMP-binding protein [Clostridia bacterium]